MKHLLFVDDEPRVLEGLKRNLHSMRHEWETEFVLDGKEALIQLGSKQFDVIISDMRMPGMDGAALLEQARQRFPYVIRIILSGQSDQDSVYRIVGHAHQYLSKPCDPADLKASIVRACSLGDLLENDSLRSLVTGLRNLPSLQRIYHQLQAALALDTSLGRIGSIIATDLGMTSRILQLVNSAFFGLRRIVNNPEQAVAYLGLDTIKTLTYGTHDFSIAPEWPTSAVCPELLWGHSLRVAKLAKFIASDLQLSPVLVDASFTAGLLHDVGALILASTYPEPYAAVLCRQEQTRGPLYVMEREALHTTHAEVGAYLLGLWGLSEAIVEAVTYHHDPMRCSARVCSPLTAVHMANALLSRPRLDRSDRHSPAYDPAYIEMLGFANRVELWQQFIPLE